MILVATDYSLPSVDLDPICIVQSVESKKQSSPVFVENQDVNKSLLEDMTSLTKRELFMLSSLESLIAQREPYVKARNSIIDNPFKYLFYKHKLRQIDTDLDKIDLKIFQYESSNMSNMQELENFLLKTTSKIDEYLRSRLE